MDLFYLCFGFYKKDLYFKNQYNYYIHLETKSEKNAKLNLLTSMLVEMTMFNILLEQHKYILALWNSLCL